MTIYSIVPNGDDTSLWRAKDEDDHLPAVIASLYGGHTAVTKGHDDDHGVVFRAAAAVLAPDEAIEARVATAIADVTEAQFANMSPLLKRSFVGAARHALNALRAHVEGSAS